MRDPRATRPAAAAAACRQQRNAMRRAKQPKQPQQQPQLSLLDLDDACLSIIVSKLGLTRRTVMTGERCTAPTVRSRRHHRRPVAFEPACSCAAVDPCSCHGALLYLTNPAVCKRLKLLAEAAVHTHQQPGQSVMDVVELAQVRCSFSTQLVVLQAARP